MQLEAQHPEHHSCNHSHTLLAAVAQLDQEQLSDQPQILLAASAVLASSSYSSSSQPQEADPLVPSGSELLHLLTLWPSHILLGSYTHSCSHNPSPQTWLHWAWWWSGSPLSRLQSPQSWWWWWWVEQRWSQRCTLHNSPRMRPDLLHSQPWHTKRNPHSLHSSAVL